MLSDLGYNPKQERGDKVSTIESEGFYAAEESEVHEGN